MPDLPRRRRQRPSWTEPIAERLTPTIKVMVLITAFVYLFYVAVRESRPLVQAYLALGPGLFEGKLWQPLTSLFVHIDFLGFVFDLIGLWFVGATIESTQGRRRFLILFLGAGVLANLAIAGVAHLLPYRSGYVLAGASDAILALFVAFGRLYGRQQTQVFGRLVMQARVLALIFVGFAVLSSLMRADWASLAGTLVAVAVGFIGAAPGGLRAIVDQLRAARLRRRYRVLEGGAARRGRNPKYWN